MKGKLHIVMVTIIAMRIVLRRTTCSTLLLSSLRLLMSRRKMNLASPSVMRCNARQMNTAGGTHSNTTRQLTIRPNTPRCMFRPCAASPEKLRAKVPTPIATMITPKLTAITLPACRTPAANSPSIPNTVRVEMRM